MNANPKADKPVNSTKSQKSKTLKSVWRKGDSVATVQKIVKEVPRPDNKNEVGKSQTGGGEKVASSEAGGITQGIGAYKVQVPVDGKQLPCVFLDTPGHELNFALFFPLDDTIIYAPVGIWGNESAWSKCNRHCIIVVAADDGIRPQTNEAIAHAKAAGVPIIIAINKAGQHDIDKDGANPDRVMQELSSIGLMPEDWGGDIPMVQISALQGKNVDDLLETVMLVAEVRALFDDGGKRVDVGTPSIPVQVIGLNNVPIAGDEFEVVESLDTARERAESRAESLRNERISAKAGDGKVTLSSLASAVSAGKLSGLDLHQLNIILKVDLQGSIEAVRQALRVLPQDNVTLKFLLEATGDVTTSDVDLAVASKAVIFGFNVKAPGSVKTYAENKAVEIRVYKVIYELIDDVRNAMEGLLDPVEDQITIGSAEVRATFSSGSGRVAGCMVTEGKVLKGCGIRVIRKGKVVHVGILDSLRRVKEIVKEVNAGLECGLALEDFDDWEDGRSMLGYSLTSPDLVICAGSPDIAGMSYDDSPELLNSKCGKNLESSMELSLENGINGLLELLPPPVTKVESPQDCSPSEFIGDDEMLEDAGVSQEAELESSEDAEDIGVEEKFQKLKRDFESQRKELAETRRELGEIKRENQQKSRECQEAWDSLKELQNELMRKSMHVGSLAFAIEGQVKEKSRWFSSLRDLMRKVKIMKMEHIKLLEEAEAYKKCEADMLEMGLIIKSKINEQQESHEDLKSKYIEGAKERKELYNKVLELRGNIRVFCRCRPLNADEIKAGATMALDFDSDKDGELTVLSNGVPRKTFKFDAVFGPQAEQADIFEDTAPFATSVLDGYNVCIFAYGQTGTGKTFTMEGTEEARGVNFRTLEKMFDIIKERQTLYRYDISVSVLEVYNEQIRDLLVSGNQPGMAARRLEIRQAGEGMHHIPGLVEAHVNNMTEVWEVLQTGSNARAVSSTNANEHSSRSHCIHCVMVKGENLLNGEHTRSKLWLVDLAGSERVAKTEVQGDRLKETQNINRSLSALGDVISALATKSSHIPFRNSKLTHLLQDSLGGDSKALMFVQISPNENDLSETICSLNFASRVRGIELGPAKKQLDTTELLKHKQMAEKTKQEVKLKDLQIKKMEETIHGLESKMKDRDNKNKNLQEKVKELESQLMIERKLARQHVDSKIAEQHQMKHQEEQNNALNRSALANRPLGSLKNFNDPASVGWCKDQVNSARPLMENNILKPCIPFTTMENSIKCIDHAEKENNPDMAEKTLLQKRTGRASICTMTPRVPSAIASRRNSLIPLPTVPSLTQLQSPLLPKLTYQGDYYQKDVNGESETSCLPAQTLSESPKEVRSGVKKIGSILRRSIHKKMQVKSPLQQHMRRVGVNVGMEKVRVSIGSRGRLTQRVQVGSGRRGGAKEIQQKNSQKEKERGWI
ncbi:Translation initiation factor aIF-2, bacterial-like [Sesbania bispinosa]|nr:Translation initiation factor aIF-2, bacterial-like [Sesbania bispinosa]